MLAEDAIDCRDFSHLVGPYLDGEAAPEDLGKIESHLESCAECATSARLLERTKARLRQEAVHDRKAAVPARLEAAIAADLGQEQARVGARRILFLGGALCLLLTGAAGALTLQEPAPNTASLAAADAIARHRLALPLDVASNDPVAVRDWLQPRLRFSPPVPALADAGYGLLGARVVTAEGARAAQLSYRGALGETLSVTAAGDPDGSMAQRWASAGADDESAGLFGLEDARLLHRAERDGLAVESWASGETVLTVVADLSPERLRAVLSGAR